MLQLKTLYPLGLTLFAALSFSACSDSAPVPFENDFVCKQDNIEAPKWTCMPHAEGYYAGLGVAQKSQAGYNLMLKEAQANGRSDLAQQIQVQVKDKLENFTRSTGVASGESVDKVTTAVTKQVANVDLRGSKMIQSWTHPTNGSLFVLMAVSEDSLNQSVQKSVRSSFKDDNALWQQFQSQQALENLEKEFPTH